MDTDTPLSTVNIQVDEKPINRKAGKWVSTVPVDEGYAWLALIAYTLMGFCTMGLMRLNGIFLLEYVEHFGSRTDKTSWVSAALLGIALSGLGGFFVPCIGARKVVFIGAFCQSLAYISSSVVTKLEHLFGTMTILNGVGFAFCFSPVMGHVSKYFDKKRGLANGIGTAAASVGTLVSAPLVTFLLHTFGLRGTLLLVGGVHMHLFIAAMLLRPLEFYKPRWEPAPGGDGVTNSANEGEIQENNATALAENDPSDYSESRCFHGKICHMCTDISFLKNPSFYLHVLVMALCFCGFNSINIILIPLRADEVGFSAYQASALISIFAGFDGVGRLFFGWVLDRNLLPRGLLLGLDLIIFGILMILYPLAGSNFAGSAAFVGAIGFSMGMIHSANVTLMIERVGISSIQRALAAMFLILALPIVFFLQIPAELYQRYGSWSPALYVSGAAEVVAGLILVLEVIHQKIRSHHQVQITRL